MTNPGTLWKCADGPHAGLLLEIPDAPVGPFPLAPPGPKGKYQGHYEPSGVDASGTPLLRYVVDLERYFFGIDGVRWCSSISGPSCTPATSKAAPPSRLFKYLPSRFVPAVVNQGVLLFRNLAHFRKIEDHGRRDFLESLHIDRPDTDVTLEDLQNGFKWSGRAAFLNGVISERVLVFCLSTELSEDLFDKFGADACIEITNPREFLARAEHRTRGQRRFPYGLMHGPVAYYQPNQAPPANVKNPEEIPFLKHHDYSKEHEYRLVLPLQKALRLQERIILPRFDLEVEVMHAQSNKRSLSIGSLTDITKVHLRTSGGDLT